MMIELRREYESDRHVVCDMRCFVRDECRVLWNTPSDAVAIGQLELAVSEVASNIILHGNRGTADQPIELELTVDDERACLTFRYIGCDFDPKTVPAPAFDSCSECGYGLYLIQNSVDDVQYFRDETGRCGIRLLKNRKRHS